MRPLLRPHGFAATHPRGLCGLRSVASRLGLLPVSSRFRSQNACDDARLLAYGKHLSAECSGCHRIDGVDHGIPSITGLATRRFHLRRWTSSKPAAAPIPAMISVARSLDEEQVKALAAYYGSLPKGRSRAATGGKKIASPAAGRARRIEFLGSASSLPTPRAPSSQTCPPRCHHTSRHFRHSSACGRQHPHLAARRKRPDGSSLPSFGA